MKDRKQTVSGPIGYMIPEFPGQTHIFFWRELITWRQWGVDVRLISTRCPRQIVCQHEFAKSAIGDTHYLFPPRLLRAILTLVARPGGTARALGYVWKLREAGWKGRMKALGFLICAADMVDHCARNGIDHVHGHSCGDSAHILALGKMLGGPRYSLTLHGDLAVYGSDHASKMGNAEFISTDGSHLKRQIVEQVGIAPERVLPTCMGLDTAQFTGEGREPSPIGRLKLLTVARLHPAKGHRHALAAMKRAVEAGNDIHYTIAGEGPERGAIEKLIGELGLKDRVILVGTVGEERVLELLRSADAFVLPSVGLGEAFPISVMEAMSSGLPVICSIIGATPDMIDHGVSGILVKMGDEQGLFEAMVSLCKDVELRGRLGAAARQKAVASFDTNITAGLLLREIEKYSSPSIPQHAEMVEQVPVGAEGK